jgi:hypothetical protein
MTWPARFHGLMQAIQGMDTKGNLHAKDYGICVAFGVGETCVGKTTPDFRGFLMVMRL